MSEFLKIGRRTFLKGSAAASALMALAACKKDDGGATAEAGTEGATAKVYINNPVSIDPYNCQESEGTQVCYQMFDCLTDFDYEKGELVPAAAESWTSNDDGTEFTFTLKEGCKFHNGDPVDAESFVRGWTRLVDPKTNTDSPSAVTYHISMVDGYDALAAGETDVLSGVSAPDDKTFVVKLAIPYADFPYVASHPALAPVPAVALEDFNAYFTAPVGNGPFMMDGKWVDGQYINLKRFEDYNGDKPKIAAIQFNIQKDMETAYKEFQAGNYDFCDVPTAQIASAQDTYGLSDDGYTITPCEKEGVGTDIIMHIKPDGEEENYSDFMREYTLRNLVKKYSDYIRWPIRMEVTKSRKKEDSPEDKPEYEDYKEEETLNSMVPLWQRKKSEVSREEYDKFYQEKFSDFTAPQSVITVSAEGQVSYKALLYIPSRPPFDYYSADYERGLQLYSAGVMELTFDETLKNVCMVMFFTSVGFQANLKVLKSGGISLLIFLGCVTALIILQNIAAVGFSQVLGVNPLLGMCTGSIPMVGGHGTAGAFGPRLEGLGLEGAKTLCVAAATFGLIGGSLMGGPLGRRLILKHDLLKTAVPVEETLPANTQETTGGAVKSYASAAYQLAIAMGVGTIVSWLLSKTGMDFPVYIGAMIVAAIMRNASEFSGKFEVPMAAIDDIGGICLSLFLGIAMITLKLWQLADLAVPLVILLVVQVVLMFLFAYFVVYNVMGRNYDAAVLAAGTCGFGMGATPNAMANMQALTDRFVPSVKAYILVPIVGSMFADFINSITITFFINML